MVERSTQPCEVSLQQPWLVVWQIWTHRYR